MKPSAGSSMDLVILTPDGAYESILTALLKRHQSIGIRPIVHRVVKDPMRDSSPRSVDLLRPFASIAKHAMIVRDLAGSGWENRGGDALRQHLEKHLWDTTWSPDRSAVLVVEPEVEDWLRIPSPHLWRLVQTQARKRKEQAEEYDLLRQHIEKIILQHTGRTACGKPSMPKEVFEDLLRSFGIPRANALYRYLATCESVRGCRSQSFARLLQLLQFWFRPAS